MSRPSSGGFVLGFAAEIAIVVAAVTLLPKLDLSGGRAAAVNTAPSFAPPSHETSFYERRNEPVAPASALHELPDSSAARYGGEGQPETYASRSPRLPFTPQPVAEPTWQREPPPLIAVDPARPAAVEQRLDRASQGLVNGLGSYVARTAESFLHQPAPPQQPHGYQPPTYPPTAYSPAPASTVAGSFATQPAQAAQPRPWMRY